MSVKIADYTFCGGPKVEYDQDAPCWYCGLPVVSASMGGTVVCPWCDCGRHRDGREWTYRETLAFFENFKRMRDAGTIGAQSNPEPSDASATSGDRS